MFIPRESKHGIEITMRKKIMKSTVYKSSKSKRDKEFFTFVLSLKYVRFGLRDPDSEDPWDICNI
jgi:hypothetical protein